MSPTCARAIELEALHAHGLSTAEIAKLYNCRDVTVRSWRRKLGIQNPGERISDRQRFDNLVLQRGPDECWEWQGAFNGNGYGLFTIKRPNHYRTAKAHRLAWEWAADASLLPFAVIMHKCDNPPCVNPNHLELGSYSQNTKDAVSRGRLKPRRGELNQNSILTEPLVFAIREMHERGVTVAAIARTTGFKYQTVWSAIKRHWRHIR